MSAAKWRRASRERPCPICQRPDWCSVSADGAVAVCMRHQSAKRVRNGGWLHRLEEREWDGWRTRRVPMPATAVHKADIPRLAAVYRIGFSPSMLQQLARQLGVANSALRALAIGWDRHAWTFPMRDSAGCIIGIRRRFPDGRKLSFRGGREGLFVPAAWCRAGSTHLPDDAGPPAGSIFVCEGPTDTAALLTIGLAAVGRPSCTGGVPLLCTLLRGRSVVVVADGDEVGQSGADALTERLRAHCRSVRRIGPPSGIKDARAWVQSGARATDLLRAACASPPAPLSVRRAGTGVPYAG